MSGWKKSAAVVALGGALALGGIGLGTTVFAEEEPSQAATLPPELEDRIARARERIAAEVDPEEHPLFGVVHADIHLTRFDGSTFDLLYDRGMILSITESEITFARLDGQTVTVAVDDETKIRDGLSEEGLDDLQVGDRAMFFSVPAADGGTPHALLIRCIQAPGEAPGAEAEAA